MTLTRRQLLAVAGGATVASVVSGCGGATTPVVDTGAALGASYDGPPVTISYWHGFTGGDGPAMRDLVARFNSSQDLITVEQNTINWAQYYQRVVAAVHAGRGPDVGAMHLEQLATQSARQTLNPLDDVLEELGISADQYPEQVWNGGMVNDVRYGVPLDVHCLASYTNRSMLERVGASGQPGTGDELRQVLDQMTGEGVETPFWMPNRWPAHLMFLSLLWQFGGEPYAEDGSEALFDSDAGVEALSWMRRQVEEGYSPDNVAVDTQYTAFKNGEGAFTWDGIWQINDLQAAGGDLDWGIAPIPTIGEQPAVWANSHHLVLFRDREPEDDRLKAGKAFIRYLTEQSAAWSGAGMIPALNEARESTEFKDSPQSALASAIPAMRFLPSVPGVPDVQTQTLETAVSEAILGRLKPDEALSDAAGRATQLLQANLDKFGR
ncbi:ABC transporter substrate-binding protein [Nocardioides sp. zg-1308]|uniref:ABC transporter substrate-binding protein n=1 Tax=Nocardioides renjunii TaxID=3095075 RepID=A0ABU5KEL0_9ACTN|nr:MULTISPECIES: ABC transporter substrate-binding protein [unclassified Nocardioides]MDZ5663407.1 ABC transporter substrate-binding protein [Nocardioides sp. S-58]NPD04833.1 ABC transporter substrate-binding protein [Nocardioides sp. zg-1308]WQQ22724.1 ABC transporter substrate-binding protein [Nocardioides sp. S-34]